MKSITIAKKGKAYKFMEIKSNILCPNFRQIYFCWDRYSAI